MSSFLIEDDTLNQIANSLFAFERNPYMSGLVRGLPEAERKSAKVLVDSMRDMNIDALVARYEGDEPDMYEPPTYRATIPAQPVAVFKSLQCFLYQCCEGDVHESELYLALTECKNKLACNIVEGLDRYKSACWG